MKFLNTLLHDVRDLFVSLKLTVVLILLSCILILVATLVAAEKPAFLSFVQTLSAP